MGDTLNKIKESQVKAENYAGAAPEFMGAFNTMAEVALTNSPFDMKTAELIFVSIAIARQCEGCILAHVPKALEAGVTREELVSLINISVLMGGGPASAFGAIALEVYDDVAKSK